MANRRRGLGCRAGFLGSHGTALVWQAGARWHALVYIDLVIKKAEKDLPDFVLFAVPDIKYMEWYKPLHEKSIHWIELPGKSFVDRAGSVVADFPFKTCWPSGTRAVTLEVCELESLDL